MKPPAAARLSAPHLLPLPVSLAAGSSSSLPQANSHKYSARMGWGKLPLYTAFPSYNWRDSVPSCLRSTENKSEGDNLHQQRYQNHPGDQEQDHLQAERRVWKGPEEIGAVAQRQLAVHLRGDEWHQCALSGHGTETGWGAGDHLGEAVAEGAERVQAHLTQYPQAAVLVCPPSPGQLQGQADHFRSGSSAIISQAQALRLQPQPGAAPLAFCTFAPLASPDLYGLRRPQAWIAIFTYRKNPPRSCRNVQTNKIMNIFMKFLTSSL